MLGMSDQGRKAAPQFRTFDLFELLFKIDPAVPDLARRQIHESEHVFAIGGHNARREAARPPVRHVRRLGRDGDAGRKPLEIDGEIDAGQRLVEIIDVEEDVVFGRIERAEVHQMTVAAGLHRRPGERLMREIGRHHRRRAAQEGERVDHHSLVALGDELGDPLGVGFRQNGDRVPIPGAMQFRVSLARGPRSQLPALLVSLGATLQSCGHGESPGRRMCAGANSRGRTGPPTIHASAAEDTASFPEPTTAPARLAPNSYVDRRASGTLHRSGSRGRRPLRSMDLREVDRSNTKSNRHGIGSASICRTSSQSAMARLTDNSATSHRERASPYGRFVSGTSFGFGRPRRMRPIHCDGGSDRSRPTRRPD